MNAKRYLSLILKGETWVAYPLGMRFPRTFRSDYPFRGRGVVSYAVYTLHVLGLDRCVLNRVANPVPECGNDVAFFWPSPKRAEDRFYGYTVKDGTIKEYLKIATSVSAKDTLRREVANVQRVADLKNRSFDVPQFRGYIEAEAGLVARFEPLPDDVASVPDDSAWMTRIYKTAQEISEAGFAHGDYCRHNVKVCGDRLWVLDWEEMHEGAPENLDAVSFFVVYEYYARKRKLVDVYAAMMKRFADLCDLGAILESMTKRKIALGSFLLSLYKNEEPARNMRCENRL